VILSGAGSDGAVGVRAVKEAGGIVLVQDPNEADYASMPRSAIATGVVDFVLPVRDLAKRLSDLIRMKENVWPPEIGNLDEDMLRRILAHLRVRTGHDFSKYKRSTVVRRIARRMQVNRTDALNDYYEIIRENQNEVDALLGDLLISVTTFFRDGEAFESFAKLLPEVSPARNRANQSVSGWPAARPVKRPIPSAFCCSRKRRGTTCGPRFRYSAPISTPGRWRRREKAAIRRRSKQT